MKRNRLVAACVLSVAVLPLMGGTYAGAAAPQASPAMHAPGWRVQLMSIPPRSARWPFVLELAAASPADAWGVGFVTLAARHPVTILDVAAIPHTTSAWATASYAGHFKFALISRRP